MKGSKERETMIKDSLIIHFIRPIIKLHSLHIRCITKPELKIQAFHGATVKHFNNLWLIGMHEHSKTHAAPASNAA